jgi:hypothetical protein
MINLGQVLRGKSKKAGETAHTAMTCFDRPQFKGFAHILKGNGSPMVDRATKGLATNSAIATRLQGTKLW